MRQTIETVMWLLYQLEPSSEEDEIDIAKCIKLLQGLLDGNIPKS